MLRNQHCRTMSLLIGMFLVLTMMSKYNVAAYTFDELDSGEESNYRSVQRLRHLIRELQRDDDEELFFKARADPLGDCASSIIDGYVYYGDILPKQHERIATAQHCMDTCDIHAQCVGWSYDTVSKWCWGYSSINGLNPSVNAKSGSCVGPSLRTRCTEQRSGQYYGIFAPTLNNINRVEDCQAQCDRSAICVSWIYNQYSKTCQLSSLVGQFVQTNGLLTGSCLAPQRRRLVPQPIKLFRREALERHNLKRSEHCTPELTLDKDLNQQAQDLANNLASIDVLPPVYDKTKMQTVFYRAADDALSGGFTVDCLYDENRSYDWANPDFRIAGHFPKIIWRSSRKMGVGRAFARDNITMYVVTKYDSDVVDMAAAYQDNVAPKCR